MDELRLAIRRLMKRPAAAIVSILTLACAIGAAAATWSLLSAVLLHPLPVKHADRLVVPGTRTTTGPLAGRVYDGVIYPYLQAFRDSGVFERVAAEWTGPLSLLTVTAAGELPVRGTIGFATYDLFDLLGVPIPLGRGLSAADDRRGAPPVAVLTDGYWRRVFDRRRDAIGSVITIAGKPVTIVGVAPPGFTGLDLSQPVDMYLALHTIGDIGSPFTNYFADAGHQSSPTAGVKIVARLREGTTVAEAAGRVSTLRMPAAGGGWSSPGFVLTSINDSAIPMTARAGMAQFTRLLGTTVALLLLIGCGTVGSLLLIRTEARREELATCIALGASRARLTRGIVLEGTVLAGAGAVLAIPVAFWLFRAAAAFQLPGSIEIGRLDLGIGLPTLAAAAAAALLASLAISLIAAAFGVTANTADSLRARGGVTPRVGRRRTRGALVAAQVAVALVLVAGAGLLARSLQAALGLNARLEMSHLVTGSIYLTPHGYSPARATAFFEDLRGRLTGNGAFTSVAYGLDQGGMLGKMEIDGVSRQVPTQVGFTVVDERYFAALGLRVTPGRDFTAGDRKGAPPVTIVSESFGRWLAGGASPIGHRVTMPYHRAGQPPEVMEVVGVVPDVVTRVSVLQPLDMYFPIAQTEPAASRTLVVRASGDPAAAVREILGAVKAIDPAVAPAPLLTLEQRIGRQMAAQRFGALVLGALGTIAVLLTILGTYVLGESMAILRMREMGIRAALGATRRQLGAMIVREAALQVGLGLAAGFAIAGAGANTIRSFLFQVQPFDPPTLVTVAASILALAAIVSIRPALRAARVDLASVLRDT
jgi:putative ABC transport system permease protein